MLVRNGVMRGRIGDNMNKLISGMGKGIEMRRGRIGEVSHRIRSGIGGEPDQYGMREK